MKTLLPDLSDKLDLLPLAQVVRSLQAAAAPLGADFFLMGAAARDLMLLHLHGIDTVRKTEDMDFGVMVRDWPMFEVVREALRASQQVRLPEGVVWCGWPALPRSLALLKLTAWQDRKYTSPGRDAADL